MTRFMFVLNRRPFELGHLYGIDREAALFSLLRKAKDDGSSVILRTRKLDGTSVPVAEMRNFTELSHTMVGKKRLDNIQYCIETVLADEIPGDFLEAGVWRGGACIFMRGVLAAYGIAARTVWAADSFAGVPPPTHPQDDGIDLSTGILPVLAVRLEEVQALFKRYDLLDAQVRFLKGWFKNTLAAAPIERRQCFGSMGTYTNRRWTRSSRYTTRFREEVLSSSTTTTPVRHADARSTSSGQRAAFRRRCRRSMNKACSGKRAEFGDRASRRPTPRRVFRARY